MSEIFLYKLFLSLHIISVIAWIAGMLYLPRLFVYHITKEVGSDSSETFKIMERRLIKFIIDPAAISSWVFGLALVYSIGVENLGQVWLQIKILLVLALSGLHGYFAKLVKDFEADKRTKNHKFYRIINELPTALLIIIVFLVIFKPN